MSTHRVAPVLALLLMLFAQTARAFFDPPYITPPTPTAGELVSVNVRGGVCDGIIETAGYPQITRIGNAIRILFFGVHIANPDFCIYPVGMATFPVAAYPAGSYTLQVDLLYDAYPFGPTVMTLGVVPFTVASIPVQAVPAPTNSPLALLALILVVVGLASWALCARRHGVLLLVLACTPLGIRAQVASENHTVEILVSTASGAPTPTQIVICYNTRAIEAVSLCNGVETA